MTAVVKTKVSAAATDANSIRDKAIFAYTEFRNSWVGFANSVAEVKRTKVWETLGYESFKEFCEREFTDLKFSAITKLVAIVEDDWVPALEAKLKTDPKALIPSYEACYQITASQDRISKSAGPKLRKAVLDGEINVSGIRKRLKELGGITERKLEEVNLTRKPKKLELKTKPDTDGLAEILIDHISLIIENLSGLSKITVITEPVAKLFSKIQEMTTPIDKFMDHVEAINVAEGAEDE